MIEMGQELLASVLISIDSIWYYWDLAMAPGRQKRSYFSYPESCMPRKGLVQFGKGSSPIVFCLSRKSKRRRGSTSTKMPLGTTIHNIELKSGKGG
jgi:hypothetical protein